MKNITFIFICLFSFCCSIYGPEETGAYASSQSSILPPKSVHWKWVPLFNHRPDRSARKELDTKESILTKQNELNKILIKLAWALGNEENGTKEFEYVGQSENDQLLFMIVNAQLKSHDLLKLIQLYKEQNQVEIREICQDVIRCDDGKKVLYSFYQMQVRVEEIESGLIETRMLPGPAREAFSLSPFLCYYMGFQDENFIKEFIEKKSKEMRTLMKTVSRDSDSTVIEYLQETLAGQRPQNKTVIERVYTDDIIARIYGNEGRLIVVNCLKKSRIEKWKKDLFYDFSNNSRITL